MFVEQMDNEASLIVSKMYTDLSFVINLNQNFSVDPCSTSLQSCFYINTRVLVVCSWVKFLNHLQCSISATDRWQSNDHLVYINILADFTSPPCGNAVTKLLKKTRE